MTVNQLNQMRRNPLLLADLFPLILDCIQPEINRPTLFALSLTCHTLSEPSLDRLWKKLYSLEPLIRCYCRNHHSLTPPTDSQFAAIQRYAQRVRELDVFFDETSGRFLECTRGRTSCLLPNLRVLRWRSSSSSPPIPPVVQLEQLLSPTLLTVQAYLTRSDEGTVSFLDSYLSKCRNLRSLMVHIPGLQVAPTTIQALSRSICHQDFQAIAIRAPIDDVALRRLATLPTLKVLCVQLSKALRTQIHSFLPTDPLFRNVESLTFKTSEMDLVVDLLRPRNQIFHSFRLFCSQIPPSMDILRLLEVLASRPCALKHLTIQAGEFYQGHLSQIDQMGSEVLRYHLSYQVLQPLMVCGTLSHLTIQWSERISLDDGELANLARSWPLLESFELVSGRGDSSSSSETKSPTLRGLMFLATFCLKIHSIALSIDVRRVPDIRDQVQDAAPRNTALKYLKFFESPINEPLLVGEFFLKYLPKVTTVHAEYLRLPGTDELEVQRYELAWKHVQAYLQASRLEHEDAGDDDIDTYPESFYPESLPVGTILAYEFQFRRLW